MIKNIAVVVCLFALACTPRPRTPRDARIDAASHLTARCAASRLSQWDIRGRAAGADCSVLLVGTSTVLDDTLVEAIHYGTGAYAVVDGGVRRFARERKFGGGVIYRDRTGRIWTYGGVDRAQAEELQPCR
jgi:hypothetical protein